MPVPVAAHAVLGNADVYVAAAASVILLYFVANQLRPGRRFAILTALALIVTPSNMGIGVEPRESSLVIPFVLAWMLGLLKFLERRQPWALVAATLSLGIGFYTQPAAPLTVCAFAALTCVVLLINGERNPRTLALGLAGFIAPLLLMIPWFVAHPETYPDTIGAWLIHKAHVRNPIDGLRAIFNWNVMGIRASTYWELFNPNFLLFGALATPLAALIPIGLYSAFARLDQQRRLLLFGGLLLSPFAAAAFGSVNASGRALAMIPFLTMLGSWGACWVLNLDHVRR